METTIIINEIIENREMDTDSISTLVSMANDYQYQSLMYQLQEEGLD
jgi:hypothetical protein